MSDIRPSSAVVRHDAAELALQLAVLDRHLARLRAKRQVLADQLGQALNRLEIREAAEAPIDVTELTSGVPELTSGATSEAIEYTVSPEIPYGDKCLEPVRGGDVCWRSKDHLGKHRGSRSMAKRAAHHRERRANGKS